MQLADYVDKIFYFCLKRCNNRMDAEDLSQTILTEAYISINKNYKIEDLEKYIFQIAYNHYSKYIDSKVKERSLVDKEYEIEKIAIEDSSLKEIIEDENVKQINNQIKLLSSEYMNIVYSYYVEDLKISEIAKNINLPLGTVKRKLYEIRNKIKEQLQMEKFNGKKAYIPKNYLFRKSCSNLGRYNPHDYVTTLIQQNLLYHSYNNPCTLEDYAIELGISMPYIEDLVNTLEEVTLLKKIDNKYVTNFAFLSKSFREEIYKEINSYKESFCKDLVELANNSVSEFKKIGFSNSNRDKIILLWNYIMIILQTVDEDANLSVEYSSKPGGGRWDFHGLELLDKPSVNYFVGFNINSNYEYISHTFDIAHPEGSGRLFDNNNSCYDSIVYLINNNINKYSEVDKDILKSVDVLIDRGLIRIEEDNIQHNPMIFRKDEFKKLKKLLNSLDIENLVKQYNNIYNNLENKVKDYIPNYLESQAKYLVSGFLSDLRSQCFNYAEEKGLLDLCIDEVNFIYNFYVILLNV